MMPMPTFEVYAENDGYYGEKPPLGFTLRISPANPTWNGFPRCRVDIDGQRLILSLTELKRAVDMLWTYHTVQEPEPRR